MVAIRAPGRPEELHEPVKTTVVFEHSDLVLLKETALRQGKSISELIRTWAKDYVKAHQENDQSSLDSSLGNPEFVALPTLGDSPRPEKVKQYSDEDLATIKKHAETWYYSIDSEQAKRAQTRPVKKGPIREHDVVYVIETKGWTRDQAIEYLVGLGYERSSSQ